MGIKSKETILSGIAPAGFKQHAWWLCWIVSEQATTRLQPSRNLHCLCLSNQAREAATETEAKTTRTAECC